MKLILGSTPLCQHVSEQYRKLKFEVETYSEEQIPQTISGFDEIFVALQKSCEDPFEADSRNVGKILHLLNSYDPDSNEGKRLLCHLLLYSQSACDAFHKNNLGSDINDKIEIWPFTMEDICAQQILFDRQSISSNSESTVHIVIFGMTEWAEAIVKNASLICHYPNYARNHNLRTRITIIDEDIVQNSEKLVSRYRYLFENSYTRLIDISQKRSKTHRPQYHRTREDFVDIEWEFVQGRPDDEIINTKLTTWISDRNQILTMAVCSDNDDSNMSMAERLSGRLQNTDIPVYVKISDLSLFRMLCFTKNIVPLCAGQAKYDVTLPLRRMAQIVNHVYSQCYSSDNGSISAPAEIDIAAAAANWEKCRDAALRWSSVCNAMSIRSKMNSLGHDESDWNTFYSLSAREIEAIAEVEHNRWSVEKLMMGFRPLTDEEQKAVASDPTMKKVLKAKKAHYDLRSYSELGKDETGKNARIYDYCLSEAIPLIANASRNTIKTEKEDIR